MTRQTPSIGLIGKKTLDIIYDKVPCLYLAALNTYGNDSFVLINDEKHPVVTGSVQGCPMATTFFNYGLSALIESLAKNSGIMQIWYCDDGYIYGSVESVLDAWRKIKEFGPNIGYWPNSKSTIYDLEVSNKFLWEKEGLTYSENGLTVLGFPVGNKKIH